MTTGLIEWLETLESRLVSNTEALDIRAFIGTDADVAAALARWQRPASVGQWDLDIAAATLDAEHAPAARQSVETALSELRGRGMGLVVVRALHILASLYPTGPMVPLHKFLRIGRFCVLLVIPPQPSAALPAGALLADWRTPLLRSVTTLQSESTRLR